MGDVAGTLYFDPEDTTQQVVTVRIVGDLQPESDESFFLELSNAVGAEVGNSRGTATILDDDTPPSSAATVSADPTVAIIEGTLNATAPITPTLLPTFGGAEDDFGTSVAMVEDLAVVGVPNDDQVGNDAGAAYVFEFDGKSWIY